MEKKGKTKYFENYSVGDANCSRCGTQERVYLAKIGDNEFCYNCAKMERVGK